MLQGEEEGCITVKFPLPKDVVVTKNNSDVKVEWSEQHLKVYFADDPSHPILNGPLRHAIRVPPVASSKWSTSEIETRWYVDDGTTFVLQLEKADKKIRWSRLFTPEYYVKRAEEGDVLEQINLALQLEVKDPKESFKWWKRAADEHHNSKAEFNVGKCYRDGIGTVKDEEKFQEYYVKAALNKFPQPLALVQVGVWMKKNELKVGKTLLLMNP